MAYQLFFNGSIIGFLIALTVGPLTLICIRRSFADGVFSGIISGLGAAVGTALFGSFTAFELTFITTFFTTYALIIKFLAGIYLLYLGIRYYFTQPFLKPETYTAMSYAHAFGSTLFLSIANPITIASFPFWFGAYGITTLNMLGAFLLTFGILVGSLVWWVILSVACMIVRTQVKTQTLSTINKVTSVLIALSGLISVIILFISW